MNLRICILLLLLSLGTSQAQEKEFVGLWWVYHGTGEPLQVRLYPDGSAWSDFPTNNPGRWRVENGQALCVWNDGWKERLVKVGEHWEKHGFRPEVNFHQSPSNRTRAYRVSPRSDGWFGPSKTVLNEL